MAKKTKNKKVGNSSVQSSSQGVKQLETNNSKIFLKILGINLIIVVVLDILYGIITAFFNTESTNLFILQSIVPAWFIIIGLVFLINLVLGIKFAAQKNSARSIAHFISAVIIPLIGAALCAQIMYIVGSIA